MWSAFTEVGVVSLHGSSSHLPCQLLKWCHCGVVGVPQIVHPDTRKAEAFLKESLLAWQEPRNCFLSKWKTLSFPHRKYQKQFERGVETFLSWKRCFQPGRQGGTLSFRSRDQPDPWCQPPPGHATDTRSAKSSGPLFLLQRSCHFCLTVLESMSWTHKSPPPSLLHYKNQPPPPNTHYYVLLHSCHR